MPKINEITVTHNQLVSASNRIKKLLGENSPSQGSIEWALFRALGDELNLDLFELNPDECTCGDKKDPNELMCEGCQKYS